MFVFLFIGERLRELRNDLNLTQEGLCKELENNYNLNLTRSAISQYENDVRTPDIHTLVVFSKFFNCSSDYLLGLSKYKNLDAALKEYLTTLVDKINA